MGRYGVKASRKRKQNVVTAKISEENCDILSDGSDSDDEGKNVTDLSNLSDNNFRLIVIEKLDTIISRQEVIDVELKGIKESILGLEKSADYHDKQLEEHQALIKQKDEQITVINTKLIESDKEKQALSDRLLALERHSRSFNLRFTGIAENQGEDTFAVLQEAFRRAGLENIRLENVHRLGKSREDKSGRQIIARFISRMDIKVVMRRRNELRSAGVMAFNDLCQTDYMEKKRLAPIMNERYSKKDKVKFQNGKLFINGSVYTG